MSHVNNEVKLGRTRSDHHHSDIVFAATIERRIDDLDLAKEFLAHGMKGVVLKSHYFPTAERAKVVTKAVPGIQAFGAIALNHSVGGLNPVAVELAGRSGNKP